MYILQRWSVSVFTRDFVIVYHEIDGRPASKNVSTRHDSPTAIKPLRRSRVVEGSRFAVKLHVPGVDPGAEHPGPVSGSVVDEFEKHLPWVVEIVLSSFNQQN